MKPLELCGRAIANSFSVNEYVLDLFGGSVSILNLEGFYNINKRLPSFASCLVKMTAICEIRPSKDYPVTADPLLCTNTVDNGLTVWDSSYDDGKGSISLKSKDKDKVIYDMSLSQAIRQELLNIVSEKHFQKLYYSSKRY